jgi:hypothetical protein
MKLRIIGSKIVSACLVLWSIVLLMLASSSITGGSDLVLAVLSPLLFITVILTIISGIILLEGMSVAEAKKEKADRQTLTKLIAILIIATVAVSTFAATKGLWYSPLSANWGDRFVYENIATGAGFASIVLTFILSALQKDIYWLTRRGKSAALDERQLKERREVFEASYRLGTLQVLLATFVFIKTVHNVPSIMANVHGSVPGHLFWLPLNLTLTFFALPLIVAALRKR